MSISKICSQKVKHSCHQILLSGFSSWLDRTGEWNSYWHGDKNPDDLGCRCASNDSCQGEGFLKKSDSAANVIQYGLYWY